MGIVRQVLFIAALLVASSIMLAVFAAPMLPSGGAAEAPSRARALQETGHPIAVIAPLPSEVSNGTTWNLDASDSSPSDPTGSILNFTWELKNGDTVRYSYSKVESYVFSKLGLYLITLTITDNHGLTDEAFTAVYSILDADMDDLPDWWEMAYFYSLDESGSGDTDGDGWTNMQEYANGLNPTEDDPQPGLIQELKENWYYLAMIAAAVVVAILLTLPVLKRKRKEQEKKKIKAALEIEKALEED